MNLYDLLLEDNRKQLIDKSKHADKVKAYGTTRYERRNMQHIYNSVDAFNKIDMNALFRANLLSFVVPVHGETDNYGVEVLFEGICDEIKREIKFNSGELEFKCIYRALVDAVNRKDILIACTCPDWKYRFAYHASKNGYNGGRPELRAADITNPNDSKGCGCKHVMNVLANLDWVVKLATTIFNYINYMAENQEDKYARLIYPVIYGKSYEKDYDKDYKFTPDEDELADTMDREDDAEVINKANERGEPEYNPEVEEPEEDES